MVTWLLIFIWPVAASNSMNNQASLVVGFGGLELPKRFQYRLLRKEASFSALDTDSEPPALGRAPVPAKAAASARQVGRAKLV